MPLYEAVTLAPPVTVVAGLVVVGVVVGALDVVVATVLLLLLGFDVVAVVVAVEDELAEPGRHCE